MRERARYGENLFTFLAYLSSRLDLFANQHQFVRADCRSKDSNAESQPPPASAGGD